MTVLDRPPQLHAVDHSHESKVELGRRYFDRYVQVIDPLYKMGWAQRMVARRLQRFYDKVQNQESPRLMVCMPPRHPLADSTLIHTPDGLVKHGDLKDGDLVYDLEDRPTKVKAVGPPSVMTHRVHFSNRQEIICGAGHLWTVYDRGTGKWETLDSTQLLERGLFASSRLPRFLLPKRQAAPRDPEHTGPQHAIALSPDPGLFITALTPVHTDLEIVGRCIEVEAYHGIYLAGLTKVPTHNSKSLTASNHWPSWVLGQDPTFEVVDASYGMSLPAGFSRRVRETVRSDPMYHAMFPDTILHPDNQSVEGWETTLMGGFRPVGRGGPLTGRGAHILIIDDIIKDAEEADSRTVRASAYDWYSSVGYTRLYPGAGVCIINTRWHVEDLAGILLQYAEDTDDEYADQWELISLPGLALNNEYLSPDGMYLETDESQETDIDALLEQGWRRIRAPGDPLHRERFDEKVLKKFRATLQPRHWEALYNQNPLPEDGAYFDIEDIRYGQPPQLEACHLFIAADTASSEAEGANDSCIGCIAYDAGRNIWCVDMVVGRMNTHAFVDTLIDMYVKYPSTLSVGIESGPISLAIMPVLEERMSERSVFLPLADPVTMRPMASKEVRARPFQGIMQCGRFWLPVNRAMPWVVKTVKQLKGFPQMSADDIVDTFAWATRMALAFGPPGQTTNGGRKQPSWRDRLHRLGMQHRTFMEG